MSPPPSMQLHAPGLFLRLALGLLLGLAVQLDARSGNAAAQAEMSECDALAGYLEAIDATGHRVAITTEVSRDPDDPPTREDFLAAAELLRTYSSELQALEPPDIAQTYHALLALGADAMARMVDAMALIGYLGILGNEAEVDDLTAQIAGEALALESQCDFAIYDHDGDDIDEAGLGAATIVVSPAATGKRDAPFPMGSSVIFVDTWSVTVIEVDADGAAAVMAHDDLNELPIDGEQYVVVTLRVTNEGAEAASFPIDRLRAVGPSTVAYGQFDDDCGLVPGALTVREILPGESMEGRICWSIRASDVDALVMYSSSAAPADRVYLALVESSGPESAAMTVGAHMLFRHPELRDTRAR